MQRFHIRTHRFTFRLEYICQIIFTNFLGGTFRISSEKESESDEIVLNYFADNQQRKGINIYCHGLLDERGILPQTIEHTTHEGLPCFFLNEASKNEITFDIFSMCFYLITRYEEYFPQELDQHGRFKAVNSLAVRHKFIPMPLIDLWVKWLANYLNTNRAQNLKFTGAYRKLVTFDIDLPYAFKGKPKWKQIGGLAKDLIGIRGHTFMSRMKFLVNGEDPFDTYEWIKEQCQLYNFELIFFVLNRHNPPKDENHLANTPELKVIMKSLQKWAALGIHPSLTAGSDAYKIVEEKRYLIKHLNQPVFKSRQHYLHLRMPDTYRALIAAGIEQDYSMGYPELMGFRASTARPFLWYDLMNECTTSLTVYPCVTMDATMRYYEDLTPDQAIERCTQLMAACKEVSGTFSFIWHNSSLSKTYGWGPWKVVFDHLIQH